MYLSKGVGQPRERINCSKLRNCCVIQSFHSRSHSTTIPQNCAGCSNVEYIYFRKGFFTWFYTVLFWVALKKCMKFRSVNVYRVVYFLFSIYFDLFLFYQYYNSSGLFQYWLYAGITIFSLHFLPCYCYLPSYFWIICVILTAKIISIFSQSILDLTVMANGY